MLYSPGMFTLKFKTPSKLFGHGMLFALPRVDTHFVVIDQPRCFCFPKVLDFTNKLTN